MKRLVGWLVLLVALLSTAGVAWAHMGAERPVITPRKATLPAGPRGKLALVLPEEGRRLRLLRGEETTYVGTFELRNVGPGPLTVTRVYLLDNETAPRNPLGVSVSSEGNIRVSIPPNGSRKYTVSWQAEKSPVSQVFGTLVVETNSASESSTEVDPPAVVAVVADRRVGPIRHLPSILVLLPIVFGLAAFAAGRKRHDRALPKAIAAVGALATLVASGYLFATFNRNITASDGNDGLQSIQRITLSSAQAIEIAFGADGIGVALPVLFAAMVLACVLAFDKREPSFWAGASLLLGGGIGLALAQGLFTIVGCSAILGLGAVVTCPADTAEARSARRMLIATGALSTALLLVGSVTLSRLGGISYLADGTVAPVTTWLPDLAQTHLANDVGRVLGLPAYRFAFLALFLGGALLLPLPFAHAVYERVAAASNDARAALLTALLPLVSAQLVLRLAIGAQVDAAAWGAESLPYVGALLLAWGALGAVSARDVGALVSRLTVARTGLFLVLTFSLTPQGIAGAWLVAVAGSIGTLGALLASAAIARRLGGTSLRELGGIFRTAPALTVLFVVGLVVASPLGLALSGAGGFAGLVGAFGRFPMLTLALLVPLAVVAAAVARGVGACVGAPPADLSSKKELEPFGGTIPDLRREDALWVSAALACLVVATFAPSLFASFVERPVRDWVPRLDPAGPTQVAATDAASGARSSV